ncbi:MAG TPA: LysM peptidoglycan-binding domain-containing protein, partial [Acidimicrobiales bacterium]|nr:LysM peptidoglycan-binding domain-containing protein [Acidimicrobiales bacterium]
MLVGVGSPLPTDFPSWSRVFTDVRVGYVPASAVVKIALGAAWIFWAFLSYEIAAEGSSWIRHHCSRRSSALGPLQVVLAKLVASVILTAPLPVRGMVLAAPLSPSNDAILLSADVATAPPTPTPDSLSLPTYLVQPRDTLWGIAERCLGDPLRWSEIASLNVGRQEGTTTFEDPNWIYPGWVLLLPADATVADASGESPVVAGPSPPPPEDPATAISGAPATTAPTEETARRPASRSGVGRVTDVVHRASVAPIGLGILGGSVVLLLDRLRRSRQRRHPRGVRISLPEADLASLELGLRAAADVDLTMSVDLGLRMFASLTKDMGEAPTVSVVRCRPDS